MSGALKRECSNCDRKSVVPQQNQMSEVVSGQTKLYRTRSSSSSCSNSNSTYIIESHGRRNKRVECYILGRMPYCRSNAMVTCNNVGFIR
jgi:hypothetical protein